LVALAIFGGLGVTFLVLTGAYSLVGPLGGLLILSLISAGVLLGRSKGDVRAQGPGRVRSGALDWACGLVALVLVAGAAGLIFLLAVCSLHPIQLGK
jgi:hypothetical protein